MKTHKESFTESFTLELGIAQKVTSKAPAEAHRQVNVPKIKHEPGITESYK